MNIECKLSKPCSCGSQHGLIFPSGNDTHAGRINCADCQKFLKWISKSEFDRATKLGLVNPLIQ
jgi:hypothetical protein